MRIFGEKCRKPRMWRFEISAKAVEKCNIILDAALVIAVSCQTPGFLDKSCSGTAGACRNWVYTYATAVSTRLHQHSTAVPNLAPKGTRRRIRHSECPPLPEAQYVLIVNPQHSLHAGSNWFTELYLFRDSQCTDAVKGRQKPRISYTQVGRCFAAMGRWRYRCFGQERIAEERGPPVRQTIQMDSYICARIVRHQQCGLARTTSDEFSVRQRRAGRNYACCAEQKSGN